ncbi:DUF4159 domain-containing protein [Candidatus Palauibacter soopunensis]|uniref:DUF4159 domain-containing protein n=1 Tax=Candidatus Palauibacter soopunensis TaxID=3056739 RepID=UPI00239FAD4A|nr:DUF4159 domain-containing protein [Candidatus Palauibacter soopunensis]MDE2877931.1 DUF4159 domain-containing protein [Candidatus Palauibacter soopunensis]
MMRPRPRSAPILAAALTAVLAAVAVTGMTARSDSPPDAAAGEASASALSERAAARDRLLEREPGLAQAVSEWGHDFYFTRAIYSSFRGWGRGGGRWATDFPKADRQFLFILHRLLTMLDLHEWENPISLADPELRRFPFLYMLEVGYMNLSEAEIEGLRGYLEAGGFLVVDDFWGEEAWSNFEYHMSRILPGRRIEPIPMDHPIFHQFYDIDAVITVPSVYNAMRGRYEECWGPCTPTVSGIFNDRGELMVVVNHNTDLGDAWEWSENPYYPIDRSTYAYELAINYIIYGLSH